MNSLKSIIKTLDEKWGLLFGWISRAGDEQHPSIIEIGEQNRVRLAANLSFLTLFAACLSAIFLIYEQGITQINLLPLVNILFLVLSSLMIRSKFYRLGILIYLVSLNFLGYLAGFIVTDYAITVVISLTTLVLLLSAALLPVSNQFIFLLINGLIPLIYPYANPDADSGNLRLMSGVFIVVGLVAMTVNRFHKRMENERIERIIGENDELNKLHRELENKIAVSTSELQLASELGQILSQVKDIKTLLPQSVQMIRDRFDLYYAQIYLTDPQNKFLILQAGSGRIGDQLLQRGHRLPIDENSLNGQAAYEVKPVIVTDTITSLTFKANPLLPNTRSEMCVPLIVGERVVGVLDIQNSVPGSLNEEKLPVFTSLAGQLAIAIENASLYEQTLRASAVSDAKTRQAIGDGWHEYLNALDQPETIVRTYSQGGLHVDTQPLAGYEPSRVHNENINLTGVKIGSIEIVREQEKEWSENEIEIIQSVASQVALQVNNLRLLEQADRYRQEAEKANRLVTRQGWQSYLEQASVDEFAYIYDQNVVEKLGDESTMVDTGSIYSEELKVRNVPIGELAIIGLEDIDDDAREFVRTISESLSAHLENLRLSDQTQQALSETHTLYNIISELNAARDYESVLDVLSHQTILSGADQSLIMFKFDKPKGINSKPEWVLPLVYKARSDLKIADRYPLNAFEVESDTLFTKTPVVIHDVVKDGRFDRITRTLFQDVFRAESTIILPLLVGDQSIGFIMGNFGRQRTFSDTEILRLTTIANQVAIAVQGMQLLEHTLARARREQILREVTNRVNSASGTDAILRNAVEQVGRALQKPVYIYLSKETGPVTEV